MNYNTESRVYFPTATTGGDVALGSTTMSTEYVNENGVGLGVDSSTIDSINDGRAASDLGSGEQIIQEQT